MQSTLWFTVFPSICLHQALPEQHNIHDIFSKLCSFKHFAKSLSVHFCLCASIRHMPKQYNLPSVFFVLLLMCFHQTFTQIAQTIKWLCLPQYLCRFFPVAINICIYVLASGMSPNCIVYPVVITHLLEIFSLISTFFNY